MDGAGRTATRRRRLRSAVPEPRGAAPKQQDGMSGMRGGRCEYRQYAAAYPAPEPARKLYGENGPIATKAERIRYACELEYFRHTSTA